MNSPTGQSAERWTRAAVWRAQHRIAANDSGRKLLQRPVATGLVWLVVAISLALPSALLLVGPLTLHEATTLFEGSFNGLHQAQPVVLKPDDGIQGRSVYFINSVEPSASFTITLSFLPYFFPRVIVCVYLLSVINLLQEPK